MRVWLRLASVLTDCNGLLAAVSMRHEQRTDF